MDRTPPRWSSSIPGLANSLLELLSSPSPHGSLKCTIIQSSTAHIQLIQSWLCYYSPILQRGNRCQSRAQNHTQCHSRNSKKSTAQAAQAVPTGKEERGHTQCHVLGARVRGFMPTAPFPPVTLTENTLTTYYVPGAVLGGIKLQVLFPFILMIHLIMCKYI